MTQITQKPRPDWGTHECPGCQGSGEAEIAFGAVIVCAVCGGSGWINAHGQLAKAHAAIQEILDRADGMSRRVSWRHDLAQLVAFARLADLLLSLVPDKPTGDAPPLVGEGKG